MKIIEAKTRILQATTKKQLNDTVHDLMTECRFKYNETLDYHDNATIATMSCCYGVAELLTLAQKRERVL